MTPEVEQKPRLIIASYGQHGSQHGSSDLCLIIALGELPILPIHWFLHCLRPSIGHYALCTLVVFFWFSLERGEFYSVGEQKPQNFQHHKNGCQEIAVCSAGSLKAALYTAKRTQH